MADDVTLLACRCGAEPILVHMGYYCYRVRCEACGEVSTIHATAAIARKKWNKERMAEMNAVALAERDARIAALEAELAKSRAWRATLADTGDELLAELRDARRRIAELEAELADAKDRIALFGDCLRRANALWMAQHPDSETYPDGVDLIVWLKEQVDTLAGRRCETCAHYDGAEHTSICWTHDSHMPPDGFCSYYEPKEAADGNV